MNDSEGHSARAMDDRVQSLWCLFYSLLATATSTYVLQNFVFN